MNRMLLLGVVVTLLRFQPVWVAYTQTAKPTGPLRIERVKGDLYMISGEGGNVAAYVTSDGVLLVDDMFDRNHADILTQLKAVTDGPRLVYRRRSNFRNRLTQFSMVKLP